NAWDVLAHMFRHARRLQRADAGKDVCFLMDAEIDHPLHEVAEAGNVEDHLGLNEVGAGLDLLAETIGPPVDRITERVLGGADEESRVDSFDLLAALEAVRIAKFCHHMNELHGIDVVDVLRLLMISETLV